MADELDIANARVCGLEATLDDERRHHHHKTQECIELQKRINHLEGVIRDFRNTILDRMRAEGIL